MDEITRITKELIKIESTSEKPEKLQEVIEYVKKELSGFKYKKYEKNKVPSILFYNDDKGLDSGFKIILNGHLDVVKGTSDQFKPIEKDGKIIGRGSLDMKSGCAVYIQLFKELSKELKYPIGLLFNTDEEIGGFDGAYHTVQEGLKSEILFASEPTDLLITRRAKGVCWIELSTKGKAAHGAHLWEGTNALELLLKGIETIKKEFPTPTKEVWETTANLAIINTPNETVNKVPDKAIAKLDIRYIPEDKRFENKSSATKFFSSLLPKNIKLKFIEFEPPAFVEEDNKYLLSLAKAIGSKNEVLRDAHGASDLRHFAKVGIPGVEFGPTGKNMHGDGEYVEIESVKKVYEIMKKFLENLGNT